jgi:L-threonylcarbamoyladenylate synthase
MVDTPKTHVIPVTPQSLEQASQTLLQGKLVSFPTETVYGLGANALNADACLQIFKSKGRPLTDPLIVHVHCMDAGLSLVNHSSDIIATTFRELGKKYWPGPLTLVSQANLDKIPMLITADTGFIGIRVPSHPVAFQLLERSGVPIAAPSANKFGHVSPTKAEHVYNDFHKDSEVLILDGGACSFGIESTVLKITETELIVIRKGGVSMQNLESHLSELTHKFTVKHLGQ